MTVDIGCDLTVFTIDPAIFSSQPLEIDVGFPMKSESLSDIHVTKLNVNFADTASLDAACGTDLTFAAINMDYSVLDWDDGQN